MARRTAPGGRSTRTSSRSSARTASTAARSWRPLEGAGIPYIGGYGAHRRGVRQLRCPTRSTAARPRCWRATAAARRELRAGLPGPARHHRRRRAAAAARRRACTAGRRDQRHATSGPPEDATDYTQQAQAALDGAGADSAAVTGPRLCDGGPRRPHRHLLRLLPAAARTTTARCGSPPSLGSVDQPLIDRTGGKDGPAGGRVRHRLVPGRRAIRAGTR